MIKIEDLEKLRIQWEASFEDQWGMFTPEYYNGGADFIEFIVSTKQRGGGE